jgi:hypothetical protein
MMKNLIRNVIFCTTILLFTNLWAFNEGKCYSDCDAQYTPCKATHNAEYCKNQILNEKNPTSCKAVCKRRAYGH